MIQTALADVIEHGSRDLYGIIAARETPADFRGRYGQVDRFQPMDTGSGRQGITMTRAAHNDKLHGFEDVRPATPRFDFGEGVGSDQKKKLIVET